MDTTQEIQETSNDFDMSSAVDSIGSELGFDESSADDSDLNLDITATEPTAPVSEGAENKTEETTVASASEDSSAPPPVEVPPPPKTWTKEEAAAWSGMSPEARSAVMRREEDMLRGIEQYKSTAAFGEQIGQALSPYVDIIRNEGQHPAQMLASMLSWHQALRYGPADQRQAAMQKLAESYGIPLGEPVEQPYVDPRLAEAQERLARLESVQAQELRQRQEQQKKAIVDEVNAFASKPENALFDDVADDVAKFVRIGMTLQEAYEKAVWANPVTRAKEMARLETEKTTKSQAALTAKAQQVTQSTAANVKSQPRTGTHNMDATGTMDDTLLSTLRKIRSQS